MGNTYHSLNQINEGFQMSQENILLVGAAGTIGYSLTKEFAKRGIRTRCLVRDPKQAKHLEDLGMELVTGDLAKPDSLPNALKGIEKVFVCTPLDPSMVQLQENLATACATAQIRHFVKISVLGSNPHSKNIFANWHGTIEQKVRDLNIPFTFLRPHYFMQNTLMFKESIKKANSIFMPMSPNAKITLVDSDDIAKVACSTLMTQGHENKSYEVTGPNALSFTDLAKLFSEFYGQSIAYTSIPYELAAQSMMEAGTPQWLIQGTSEFYRFFDTGDAGFVRTTVTDVTKQPATAFKDFLIRYANFLKN